MGHQQFCLKWNNYQSNMSDVFQSMLLNENMVDVTLACEGASLKAHKMVLAACSPFFHSLFLSNPCKHPIVILKDIRFIDLKAIIDFMYRGEVNVSQEQLGTLLKAAETLKVKGLAEVTEKHARAQPQMPSAMFRKSKKRKRNRNRPNSAKESGPESESEEEIINPRMFRPDNKIGQRAIPQRPLIDKEISLPPTKSHVQLPPLRPLPSPNCPNSDQIEPSRLLEQSMSTGEMDTNQNGENLIVASDVHALADEEEIKPMAFFDDAMGMSHVPPPMLTLPGPSGPSQTPQARRLMMSEAQKFVLKDFLSRPIAYFDVVIDDWKKSIVWQYFGELAYKDPETGTVSVIDNERHYCLKCIVESQERNPEECFEKCNICFLSNGTATGNHKNHLRLRHHIVDDQQKFIPRGPGRIRKRSSRAMAIPMDNIGDECMP